MKIQILNGDDHGVLPSELRALKKVESYLEVMGEAVDGVEALRLAEAVHADMVLLDLRNGTMTLMGVPHDLPATDGG
jgi:DNA-binding NarL/FixJ family response regulator